MGNNKAPIHIPAVDAERAFTAANRPVDWLDLRRYLGEWHEIARLPASFEKSCSTAATATYSRGAEGALRVRNACRRPDGSVDEALGLARPTEIAGALKVCFAPRWLRWLPFTWADYWVVDLDPSYRWAVVGGPSREYLWILARQPLMARNLFVRLKLSAANKGYPVDRLVVVGEVN